jgi:ubiquinone/menaquinone biosynthesis C-methylase UbiE
MTSPELVRDQYRSEDKLEARRSIWHDPPDGRGPATVAAEAVHAQAPGRILEIGCGTGAFALRMVTENPDAEVVATDQSPRLVELTAARGVPAEQADAQDLPFDDASFDVIVAMWMLYHVPDLDRALSEARRVLQPGGLFVAVTNGDEHLAELLAEAGGTKMVTQFSSENGEESLRRHFGAVVAEHITTRASFPDHDAAVAYLNTFDATLAGRLPRFEGSRSYPGATTVFLAA